MNKNIDILVGTRPNFIKITQFRSVASKLGGINFRIVHTGQHYDAMMADIFFQQFNLKPDIYLNVSSGTPNKLIAGIIINLEELYTQQKPDMLIVVGDVNSTLAGAISANKMGIKLAHLESGLRSFDKTMPEESNRVVVDDLADFHFVTEQSGIDNLLQEGKDNANIYFVGNTMIDTLVAFDSHIKKTEILKELNLIPDNFVLMTMHRPATVDNLNGLTLLLKIISQISKTNKVVFPIHPRTLKKVEDWGLKMELESLDNLVLTKPMDYFSFQNLIANCKFVLTDSGGIQEETTYRRKPCLTLRPNTERPSTIEIGSNTLISFDIEEIEKNVAKIEKGQYKKGSVPELWDGSATTRIIDQLNRL